MKKFTKLFKGRTQGPPEESPAQKEFNENNPRAEMAPVKRKSTIKPRVASRIRKNSCSICSTSPRLCICSSCTICGTTFFTLKGMRHCTRCWYPVCDSCFTFRHGTAHLSMRSSDAENFVVCELCALPLATMEMASATKEACDNPPNSFSISFSWGLYALLSAGTVHRTCFNPSCERRHTYCRECANCLVPTTPSCMFSSLLNQRKPPQLMETSSLLGLNRMYATEQRCSVTQLSHEQSLALVDAAFPTAQWSALPSGISEEMAEGSGTAENSVITSIAFTSLLCSVAATIAEVPPSMMDGMLGLCDHPCSKLLYVKATEKTHTQFGCAGDRTEIIVFSKGAYSCISARLQGGMTTREVWKTGRSAAQIGLIAHSASKAKELGGSEVLFRFYALQSVYAELESSTSLKKLREDVIAMREHGIRVVLCGHGLGGAIATLLTFILLMESTQLMLERNSEGSPHGIQCITFGCPAVLGGTKCVEFLEESNLISCFHHFVRGSDLLPRFHVLPQFFHLGPADVSESVFSKISKEFFGVVLMWLEEQVLLVESNTERTSGKPEINDEAVKKEDEMASELTTLSNSFEQAAWWHTGDILKRHREPCDSEWFNLEHYKESQNTTLSKFLPRDSDPILFGCFHCFSFDPEHFYFFCNSAVQIRENLVQRKSLRIMLSDHLLPSYSKSILGYIHSCCAFNKR